jgi:tetratricopeptide (TPR) repeat protein
MKKISVLLLGIAISLQGWAQNSKVTSAVMHMEAYGSQRDTTELAAAKAAIDEAAVNDKTKDEPKMYLYRGEVYVTCFSVRLNSMESKALTAGAKDVGKVAADAYTNMDTNTICVAVNSFVKVLQLAPKDSYADEAKDKPNLPAAISYLENKALMEYKVGRYTTSLALYQKVLTAFTALNISDSTYSQYVEYCAISAQSAGNNALALTYYQKLIDLKYDKATPYKSVSNIYLKQNDSAKAWDYIEKGRAQYPDDLSLIITETNFYITRHNYEKAEGNLTLTITKVQQRPDKDKNKALLASLYSNLGGIYDHKANPKDASGNDLPKPANYDTLFANADSNYSKALAVNPNDFDVLFARGALYFNRGVPIAKKANDLPYSAKAQYDKLLNEAKGYFLQAQPYFERAHKVNPNDAANTNALMAVYGSTDQTDKAAALKANK